MNDNQPGTIHAPFSADQVDALNLYQRSGFVHQFMCGNSHDGDRDLVATRAGWVCCHCDYRQSWAHAWMTNEIKLAEEDQAILTRFRTEVIEKIRERVSSRLDSHLSDMKPNFDDSIVGFNEAWDLMRKVFDEVTEEEKAA